MANWQRNAVEDLQSLNYWTEFLANSAERINALDADITNIHSALKDSTPVQGGTSTAEDRLISNIDERERLSMNMQIIAAKKKAVEGALSVLTADERTILDRFFINRMNGHIDRLKNEFGVEVAAVYKMKDAALRHFTMALYGIINL